MLADGAPIVIYKPDDSDVAIKFMVDAEHRTIWATQKQIAEVLKISVQAVNSHIQNFKEQRGERACRDIKYCLITASDGKTYDVECFNTTVIAFIGFRARASDRVMAFQDWVGEIMDRFIAEQTRPLTPAEQLLAAAQQLVQHERTLAAIQEEQREQAQRIADLELRQTAIERGTEYFTVLAFASRCGRHLDIAKAQALGKYAARYSRKHGYPIGEAPDARYGKVNTYHEDALRAVFGMSEQ